MLVKLYVWFIRAIKLTLNAWMMSYRIQVGIVDKDHQWTSNIMKPIRPNDLSKIKSPLRHLQRLQAHIIRYLFFKPAKNQNPRPNHDLNTPRLHNTSKINCILLLANIFHSPFDSHCGLKIWDCDRWVIYECVGYFVCLWAACAFSFIRRGKKNFVNLILCIANVAEKDNVVRWF